MAWRFKASKYKNAAPIVPKPEACIRDICVGSYQTFGNNICSSAAFMAFNWEHVGSSMAVLPLDDCGRKSKSMPLLHAHSDTITDMDFSPFHDGLLLTGSQDSMVKVWHIPREGLKESISTPECVLSHKQRRVENVGFHPVADGLIHVASGHELALWDLTTQKEAFVNKEHTEVIQSTSWKKDGKLLATSCKDKKVRIIDPRAATSVLDTANSHQNIKDSRIVWLGDQDRILTTGFDAARLRQVIIRDVRNLSQTQKTLELDCSTGILMPLFDADTNMLFLAGKGDTTIMYMELTDKEPYLIEGLRHSGEQTKGACLVPKRALRVMEGEVNRVLQLTGNTVIPIMYQVPRKSYRDYHADLYPDTAGATTYLSAPMWLQNQDHPVPNISLNPEANNLKQVHRGNLKDLVNTILSMPKPNMTEKKPIVSDVKNNEPIVRQPVEKAQEHTDPIDFVNVKNLIKDMEKHKEKPQDKPLDIKSFEKREKSFIRETNGHSKSIDDGFEDDDKVFRRNAENDHTDETDKVTKPIRDIKNGQSYEEDEKMHIKEKANLVKEKVDIVKEKADTLKEKADIINEKIDLVKEKANAMKDKVVIVKLEEKIFERDDNKVKEQITNETSVLFSQGGINFSQAEAPKPLPRSSISEAGSEETNVDIPKPKPRTTAVSATGYKPRLGPKPFSASSSTEEFSFDKVFSVPVVPGQAAPQTDTAISPICVSPKNGFDKRSQLAEECLPGQKATLKLDDKPTVRVPSDLAPKDCSTSTPKAEEKPSSPVSDIESTPAKEAEYSNGKSDTSLEEEANSSDSGYRPKTPRSATSDRRKIFETNDGSSIAERRRAYEARSVSMVAETDTPPSPAPLRRRDSLKARKSPDREDKRASVPNIATKRTSTVFGRVSKFRHLKGTPAHKSTHIENIKNVSRQISGECNGFQANGYRCAVPIGGAGVSGGGRLAVVELPVGATAVSRAPPPHPQASQHPHALLHPAPLQDWTFDPFAPDRLLVACDDGALREWIIPAEGLKESTNEPARCFAAHPDKIYIVRFHPTASDVLTTAAHDLTVKIWDLTPAQPVCAITLTGHTDQIFSLDWSPCGDYLATVCKDGLIRVYKPQASTEPVRSGPGPVGTRGARIVWALGASHLVVTGFDKVSERQIMLFKADELTKPVCVVGLDVSPAILQINIDHDSNTLFLTGRGDSTIYCYEVTCEPPHLCALSHHRAPTLHQGIAFLQKNLLAVEKVEFARALRLTNGNVEPLSFTVPRIKSELFQDDLFPPTLVTWEPWLSGAEWLAGKSVAPRTRSLQPPGMEPPDVKTMTIPVVSAQSHPSPQMAPKVAHEARAPQKPKPDLIRSHVTSDKDMQDNIIKSMTSKVQQHLKLEQDGVEGIDDSEWD